MVLYTCPRCNYSTQQKNDYRKHLNRKKPCIIRNMNIPIELCRKEFLGNNSEKLLNSPNFTQNVSKNEQKNAKILTHFTQNEQFKRKQQNFICNICNKQFKRKYNLKRHLATCKLVNSDNDAKISSLNSFKKDLIIENKDQIIDELKSQIEVLLRNRGNNTINNITYNTQIVINPFGKEDLSYITKDFISGLIQSGPVNSIPKLLKYIHFNPEHIENQNIKIPNKKEPYAEVFNGSIWEISDKKRTIKDMTDKAFSIINKHYNGGNEYMNQFKDKYDNDNKPLNKRITRDTEMMILNFQKEI